MSRKDFPYQIILVVAIIVTAVVAWPLSLSAKDVFYVQQMYLLAFTTTFVVVAVVVVGHQLYARIRERRSRHPDEFNRE